MSPKRREVMAEAMTKEQWRSYVDYASRPREFPTIPDRGAYLARDRASRESVDWIRFGHHSEFIVLRTQPMIDIHNALRLKLISNEKKRAGARRGAAIDGPPTTGKSTIARTFAADYENTLRRRYPERWEQGNEDYIRDYLPVVYLSVPGDGTTKDLAAALAEFLEQPVGKKATKTEITTLIVKALLRVGTELIIIDDAHLVDFRSKDGRVVNDYLKALTNSVPATIVYVGHDLEKSGLLSEGKGVTAKEGKVDPDSRATQTSGRNARHNVTKYKITTDEQIIEWALVIKAMEEALLLYGHEPGSLAERHWEYLHERTGGSIAALEELITNAANLAIIESDGRATEAITPQLMEKVTINYNSETQREHTRRAKTRARKRPANPTTDAGQSEETAA